MIDIILDIALVGITVYICWKIWAKKSDYSGPGLFTSRNNRWW